MGSTSLLVPPAVFLECPGNPRLTFKNWLASFENYLTAIDGGEFSDARKKAILIHCLGTEGQRVFNTLSASTSSYAEAIAALRAFFSPKVNVVAERYKFRQRAQLEGESTDQYVSVLRELVVNCAFGALESEMIRDQLVEKTSIGRVRERLLLESELTLEKSLVLARQVETALKEAKLLTQRDPFRVDAIIDKPNASENHTFKRMCFRCGSSNHLANDYCCPAKNAECRVCGRVGHFGKICRSDKALQKDAKGSNCGRSKGTVPEVTVLNVCSRELRKKILCPVTIYASDSEYKMVDLVVDTGSDVSILPYKEFTTIFGARTRLSPAAKNLVTYSGQPLPVLGCIHAKAKIGKASMQVCFYIVKSGSAILGLDMFQNMHLRLAGHPEVPTITAEIRAISKMPIDTEHEGENEDDILEVARINASISAVQYKEFQELSAVCPVLSKLRTQIAKGWPEKRKDVPSDLLPYFPIRGELSVIGELVTRGTYRMVVPTALQGTLIDLAHETHQGIVRTKQRLREKYWWPGMDHLIEENIKNCSVCGQHDKSAVRFQPPLQPVELPSRPWEKIAVDIMGPFERAAPECRYLLTVIDYRSKWPEVGLLSRIDTASIMQCLDSIFAREGSPEVLVSDNGPQFVCHEFSEYLSTKGIRQIRSSNYYPQSNGEIERFNRVISDAFKTALISRTDWKQFLTSFLMDYRATPHATTGISPSEILHGRKLRTKLDIFPIQPTTPKYSELESRVQEKQEKAANYTDKKRGAKHKSFSVGESVRVRKSGFKRKGESVFSKRKTVTEKIAPYTYRLDDGKAWNASKFATIAYPEVPEENINKELEPLRRSSRERRPPTWMADYVPF